MATNAPSTPTKIFNDPIHGHIELHPLLIRIIDTPQFQRLRYIKQMGAIYYVFPGASHNRFEHSLGVAYLAGCLVKELQKKQLENNGQSDDTINERDILCVQIAGLCHDLGHGPFSHLFDQKFMPRAIPGKKFEHEKASKDMLDHLIKANKLQNVMKEHDLVFKQIEDEGASKNENDDLVFIKEMIFGPGKGSDGKDLPYKGRGKNKHFLYEIVANKISGIDVDKMDYFARDCHHLGLQNNFDFKRFLAFARICETKDGKHICIRDKEVFNIYNLFHTRYCLHQRACQHKVGKIIETMITDALLKADSHEKISESVKDMAAYTKLTDSILQKILHSENDELKNAREILINLEKRQLYKLVAEKKITDDIMKKISEFVKDPAQSAILEEDFRLDRKISKFENYVARSAILEEENFRLDYICMNYGKKDKNPINDVCIYKKSSPDVAKKITNDQISPMLPKVFEENIIRVYCTKTDDTVMEAVKKGFSDWWAKEFPE